jgi:hypothetical protein
VQNLFGLRRVFLLSGGDDLQRAPFDPMAAAIGWLDAPGDGWA